MIMNKPLPTQRARTSWLFLYVIALIALSRVLVGEWLPPATGEGLWFFTAAASLLLGDLVVSPYFVRPRDSLSFAVPAAIAIWAVIDLSPERPTTFGYVVLMYCLLTGLTAGLAMMLPSIPSRQLNTAASKLSDLTQTVGHPRALFSAVFLFAIVQFHLDNAVEAFVVTAVWAVLIGVRPERPLYWTWQRLRSKRSAPSDLGGVIGYQRPGSLLIRQESSTSVELGTILICNDALGSLKLAVALDYIGRDQAMLLRAMEINHLSTDTVEWLSRMSHSLGPDRVGRVDHTEMPSVVIADLPILSRIKHLVGVVAENTSIERLYFDAVMERDIEEGHLVSAVIRGQEALFQILNGLAKEEIVHQKHKYGYARVECRKIGRWDTERQKLNPVKWLPPINSPVFLAPRIDPTRQLNTVGHFPGTKYPVGLKSVSDLVTHNTAILGILGIGKSMLAIELVERMLSTGIKVVCLDLTNQYAEELADWTMPHVDQASLRRIQEEALRDQEDFAENPEEGGSFRHLKAALRTELSEFMSSSSYPLKILNPAQFEATRQQSEPRSFRDDSGSWQRGAALWSVTPVQVTEVVAETLLALSQDSMRDHAHVCLVLEEAHSLIPEWNTVANDVDRNATNATARAILQGRKYGFGCLLVTQRTANVTKTILNQCNSVFAMRTFDDTGKAFLSNYIGAEYTNVLPTLGEREAVFFGKASTCENPVRIRLNDQDDFRAVFRQENPPPEIKDSIEESRTEEETESFSEEDDEDIPF